jgi:hypothetical protein
VRLTYANCLLGGADDCDVLLTDEVSVAEAAPAGVRVLLTDTLYEPDEAQALNVEIFRAAFDWFRTTGIDPTRVDGISAADLASIEITCTLLMPAARGWLGTAAALAPDGPLRGETPESITICAPEPASPEARRYRAIEGLQCDGAEAAVRARFGDSVAIARRDGEPVSGLLEQKYAQTRDWTWLVPQTRAEHLGQAVPAGIINAIAAARGRRGAESLLVYEYNPTNAFAEQYGAATEGRLRLARCRTPRRDLPQIIRRADRLVVPPRAVAATATGDDHLSALACYIREHDDAYRERFRLRGVDFWPLIRERLLEVVSGYEAFVTGAAPSWRARLRRDRVRAVVVPFDTPPEARLLMSVAQAEEIPTFLVNDGFKADDFSMDGMTIDHVLAWSRALAENYYSRRVGTPAVVTGNPKADAQRAVRSHRIAPATVRQILVGSFTFSPVDLNCRRSDSESFLRGVLGGIRESRLARGAAVRLKLHPADRPDYYRAVFGAIPEVPVQIITQGDVVGEFDTADIYITTYSTSLLEAVARDLPVIYYRVNPQRLHAPFADDPFLEARTAHSAQELAALLDDPGLREPLGPAVRDAWVQRYLGATDGRSTERIADAILATLNDRASAPG